MQEAINRRNFNTEEPKTDTYEDCKDSDDGGEGRSGLDLTVESCGEERSTLEKGTDRPSFSDKTKRKKKRSKSSVICLSNCRYELIRQISRRFAMRDGNENWNVYWTDLSISVERCKDMKRFQRINHFPGMLEICRKDLLAKNLNRMIKIFPHDYDIYPKSWCLPSDYGDLSEFAKNRRNRTYILKPDIGCQGRGIFITKNVKDLRSYDKMICQIYLNKPFLIDGFKFDMRIYALITSCDPLRIFVYNEGLARFATKKYKEPNAININNMYMHLTNYSVNKHSRAYIIDDIEGSKRRLSTINQWFEKNNFDVSKIWGAVDDVIIKTIIVCLPTLKHYYHTCFPNHYFSQACFELLGFDFLLDNKLKPYVLEVNHSPSFHTDTQIDRDIKESLLYDTFQILNLSQNDRIKVIQEDKKRVRERLFSNVKGLNSSINQEKEQGEFLLKSRIEWENLHMGNFRKVYPGSGSEKYEKFISIKNNSVFGENMNVKNLRLSRKSKGEHDSYKTKDDRIIPCPDSKELITADDSHLENNSEIKDSGVKKLSHEPVIIDENDEQERLSLLAKREFLIHSHGLFQKIYDVIKKSGQLRMEDEIKYGRSNNWDFNSRFEELFESQRQKFTHSVHKIIDCIAKNKGFRATDKQMLNSIFMRSKLFTKPDVLGSAGDSSPMRTTGSCKGIVADGAGNGVYIVDGRKIIARGDQEDPSWTVAACNYSKHGEDTTACVGQSKWMTRA